MSPPHRRDHVDEDVFPARAGMSRAARLGCQRMISFPRTLGDEPFRDAMAKGEITFSPHAWG